MPLPAPRTQIAICAVLLLVGVGLLAIPSTGEGDVLVPISDGHGLSALDAIGAALLAVAATWLEILIIWRVPRLGLPPRVLFGLGVAGGLGIGLLVASAYNTFFSWWAVGAAVFSLVLLVLAGLAARRQPAN